MGGYIDWQLQHGGYINRQLPHGGYIDRQLPHGGYIDRQLQHGGYIDRQLPHGGYIDRQLQHGGYIDRQLPHGGYIDRQLQHGGYIDRQLQHGGGELQMGVGKVAAQVAHACLGLFRKLIDEQIKYAEMLISWEQFGETKIVVKGENIGQLKELQAKAESLGLPNYTVQDAGRTQIAAGSTTVLAIIGKVDAVDQVSGKLKLL